MDGTGALWKLPEATRITSLPGADRIVAFSPDGKRIAGCCRQIGVWNRSGAQELSLSTLDLQGEPQNIALSTDGRLLAIGILGGKLGFAVYDLETRQAVTRYEIEASGDATAIAFAPNGDLFFVPRSKIEVHSAAPGNSRRRWIRKSARRIGSRSVREAATTEPPGEARGPQAEEREKRPG